MIVSAYCDRGNPDIIRYSWQGKTLVFVSGRQYLTQSETELAASVGYVWPSGDEDHTASPVIDRDPADRAELWVRLFQRMSDWWQSIDGGPFAATPGGLAMSYVRKRLAPKTVLSCQEPEIRKLEEASLYGGRATTWFYGPVTPNPNGESGHPQLAYGRPWPVLRGPLDHYDVRAMYPTILATERFPVRYLHEWRQPSIALLNDMLERWCVIASVRLRTDDAEYPVRNKDRVSFPAGTFDAVLTTPELRRALDSGAVLSCYRAVTYAGGRPFAEAMQQLLELRRLADESRDPVTGLFVKLVSNAFGGKLAQRSHEWQRRPGATAVEEWGEWMHTDHATGGRRHYRSRAGLVDEKVRVEIPVRPLAAIFAHLTAYGRDLMRRARESLPPRTVVSQDTDGLWVTRYTGGSLVGAPVLVAHPSYRLRLDKTIERGRWFGPRHYWTDRGWVLAGLMGPVPSDDGTGFLATSSHLPRNTGGMGPPVWVYEDRTFKRLGDIPVDGSVGPDGWAVPRRLRVT